jgi:protein SCO1/2
VCAALVTVLVPACAGSDGERAGDVTTPGALPSSVTPSVSPSGSLGHEHAEAPLDPDIALPASGFYARVEPSPAALPAGVLTDQAGTPFDMADVTRGVDVALVYFGYTNCPDICPAELGTVASTLRGVPDRVADRVRMVFVTVDPARDDVERMGEYVALFDPRFVGLTGDGKAIERLMVEMGLEPANKLPTGGGEYAMSHPAEVLAFTSDRRAHLVFPFGMTVPQWTHDLWKLVDEGWRQR